MSESHLMQKLADSVAKMSDQMSIEQMRLYQEYVTKSLEAREAQEAFMMAVEDETGADLVTSERLQNIRRVLADLKYRLSGSECVLLACLAKALEGEDYVDTKRLNILLHSYDRKPSNTTKIVDTLEKKSWLEIRSDGLHAHKLFRLTRGGEDHAGDLLVRLIQAGGNDRLAVVE
jgi:DNA-binding MarR family transcriptional regulator